MFRLAFVTLFSSTALASIINCNPSSVFTVNGLGFWPDPAIKNANSTVSFDYTVPAEITEGSTHYTYSFNGIPFQPTIEDLCTQTQCPILPGTYNQSSSSDFPDISGKITIKIEWFDKDSTSLLCAQISTKA
jgi:ML domain